MRRQQGSLLGLLLRDFQLRQLLRARAGARAIFRRARGDFRLVKGALLASSELSSRGWEWPWWRTTRQDVMVLPWFILIHLTAAAGLILFPWPGWRIFFAALALSWIGGIGTTVCYHRGLAHRALRLHPVTGGS
jgi:hypothetical protein